MRARERILSLRHVTLIALLALVFAAEAQWSAATTSGTFDESTYLRIGRYLWIAHDGSEAAGWGVAPLPVLLTTAAPAVAGWPAYRREITLARTSAIVFFAIPFVACVYWMLLSAGGSRAALAGTWLIVLSPNLIAHAALATTDLCFVTTALAALAALMHHIEHRSAQSLALLACAASIALAAKYSALALFAVIAIAWFASAPVRSLRRAVDAVVLSTGLFVAALLFGWILHALTLVPYGLPPFENIRLPGSVVGLARQLHHQTLGEPAFLFGRHSTSGWWYYIPVALALKSTPAELIVFLGGAMALAGGWRGVSPRARVLRLGVAVFGAAALLNHIDLGVRYGLLFIPLFVLLAAEWWASRSGRRGWQVVVGVLIAGQAVSALSIAPHYLSYFNALSGGPSVGYTRLADSNVDWGQDLPSLARALAQVGARHPLLSYFGTAPPDAYGVHADPWDGSVRDHFERWDWVAISATNLDGVFLQNDPFADFRALAADRRAAFSIFLYSTARAEVRLAMATAAKRLE